MDTKYLFVFSFLSVLTLSKSFAQINDIETYRSSVNKYSRALYESVKDEDDWEHTGDDLKSLIKDAESDLEAKSGLTFQEKNELRNIKKYLQALYVFGESVNPGKNSHFNGKTLRLVRELLPNLTFEFYFSELDVDVYRMTLGNYVVYLAYHNDGFLGKTIGWKKLNEPACGSIMGELTVLAGVYKHFWNNSKCLNKTNFKFKITKNIFIIDLTNQMYFYDDRPYEN